MKQPKHTTASRKQKKESHEEGWEPSVPGVNDSLTRDERSLDVGGSGEFAPGGYYNQQGATKPDRIDLDEYVAPRRQVSKKE